MKPQLHVSGLQQLWKCGEQYRRRYICGEKTPPAAAMVLGSGVDEATTKDLGAKIDTGELLPKEQVLDIARDYVAAKTAEEVTYNGEWADLEPGAAEGKLIDAAVTLSGLHHDQCAPGMTPVYVQRQWTLDVAGIDHQLTGTMDVDEGDLISDTKTSRKSPAADLAHVSPQGTLYVLAKWKVDGVLADFRLNFLVNLKTPKLVQLRASRQKEDFQHVLERVAMADRQIAAGIFQPAPLDAWWCSANWCAYHSTCPYARKPMSIAAKGEKE